MTKNNLELWNKVEKTNPEYTKRITINKRTFTTIDAYYQIKIATEQFGKYGETWGLKNTKIELREMADKTILALYSAVFFYPDGEFEVNNAIKVQYITSGGSGYVKVDDEFAKKLETDTLTKALSKLGFNADVFLGKFDDIRYVNQLKEENSKPVEIPKKAKEQPKEAKVSWKDNFIETMKQQLDRIGAEKYTKALEEFGIKSINEVNDKALATKIYKKVKTVK
jgi:hypothetical protein